MRVRIGELVLSEEVQTRVRLDPATVREYQDIYADMKETKKRPMKPLPPVAVWMVGKLPYVVDGFHRVAAALMAGVDALTVEVVGHGKLIDAQILAMTYNHTHGAKRTAADKQLTVKRALELMPNWSDQAIADHCHVDRKTVTAARQPTQTEPTSVISYNGPGCPNGQGDNVGIEGTIDESVPASEPKLAPKLLSEELGEVVEGGVEEAPRDRKTRFVERRQGKDGKLYPANPKARVSKKTAIDDGAVEEALALIKQTRYTLTSWAKAEKDEHVKTALESAAHDIEVAHKGLALRKRIACPECNGKVAHLEDRRCDTCGKRRWITVGNAANLKAR